MYLQQRTKILGFLILAKKCALNMFGLCFFSSVVRLWLYEINKAASTY